MACTVPVGYFHYKEYNTEWACLMAEGENVCHMNGRTTSLLIKHIVHKQEHQKPMLIMMLISSQCYATCPTAIL